jgi:hypothetical protein
LETRKEIMRGWLDVADSLDLQGEAVLAGEVRLFARHVPHVMTDRERIAFAFVHAMEQRGQRKQQDARTATHDLTR